MFYEFYPEIDSTNDELKRRAGEGRCPEYTVVSAGMQTGGRGRSGHTWSSPPGSSVSTSMIIYPEGIEASHLPRLTPISAVAVAAAIEELYGLLAEIKWPNDVLLNKKKVCGILTEMLPAAGGMPACVIVGIGVNVHIRDFPQEIADIATSIDIAIESAASGQVPIRTHCEDITRGIWEHFYEYYQDFKRTEDLSGILDFYNKRLVNRGRRVRIMDPIAPYEGEALFIDETGALHVMTDTGERLVDSGEVSVRGIAGYV